MMYARLFAVALCSFIFMPSPVAPAASPRGDGDKESTEQKTDHAKSVATEPSVTHHTTTIDGVRIPYTATAGTMQLDDDDGKLRANMFFVAYTRSDVDNVSRRPITFVFNGGPGSASIWLHMGLTGPKRVVVGDDPVPPTPPYTLADNEHSPLDITDLVMIDPVTTGFSRPAEGEEAGQFHGYNEDVASVGDFIRAYTTRNGRWASPKFLLGESYGTTRAAGLSGYLQDRHGMFLNGIAMISSVLNFQTLRFGTGNDLPYILFMPTYTATAWYHKRLAEPLQQDLHRTLAEAESFALGDYTLALMKGADLSDEQRERTARRLARYTGLSVEFVKRANLRISMSRFAKELLRDQRKTTGRLDSRYTAVDRDAAGDRYEFDASNSAIQGPYTAAFNHYVRRELGYENDSVYEVLTGKVRPWNYSRFQNRYLDAGETLRSAMSQNPHLKVFVANGFYDLATPFLASKYTYSHLQLEPHLQKNISMSYYEAGHMMYIHGPSLAKLKKDLTAFYTAATQK